MYGFILKFYTPHCEMHDPHKRYIKIKLVPIKLNNYLKCKL